MQAARDHRVSWPVVAADLAGEARRMATGQGDSDGLGVVQRDALVEVAVLDVQRSRQGGGFQVEQPGDASGRPAEADDASDRRRRQVQ
jgi:hypothetical protein